MIQIQFTQKADGWYEATIPGFTGTLQVDRIKMSKIAIYGKTAGCKDKKMFEEESETTLETINVAPCVSLHIVCDSVVSKAQYEED